MMTTDQLRRWAEALCRLDRAEPAATLSALVLPGDIEETASWVTLASPPAGATAARLGKRDGVVDQLTLELAADSAPARSDFEAAFGVGNQLPTMSSAPLYQVMYYVTVDGAPFTCAVVPQFSTSPGPESRPHTVLLRRDRATGRSS